MQPDRVTGPSTPRRGQLLPGAAAGLPAVTALLRSATGVRHAGLAIALVAVAIMAWRTIGYQFDEGLVYARYAQNFADGHGLVFEAGENRNATASYLYAWLLVPLALAGLDVPLAANILGAVAVALTVVLLTRFLIPPRDWVSGFAGAAAGIVYAVSAVNFASLGVEMPIALLFATGALCAARATRDVLAGVCCGLAAACRPEFVLLAIALLLVTGIARRSLPLVFGVTFLGAFAPFVLLSAVYYGELAPRALSAYSLLERSGFGGERPVFLRGAQGVFDTLAAGLGMTITFACVAIAIFAVSTLRRARPSHREPAGDGLATLGWALVVFAAAWVTLYSLLEVPAYHWQVAPLAWALCIGSALAAAAGYRLAVRTNPRSRPFVTGFAAVALVALAVSSVARLDNPPRDRDKAYVSIARWLDANGGDDCTVATAQVGHLAWYSDCATSDVFGLITPGNSGPFDRGDFDPRLARGTPKYVVTFAPLAPYERGVLKAVLAGQYRPVENVLFPGRHLFEWAGRDPAFTGWLLGANIGDEDPALNENLYAVGGVLKPALFMHVSQSHDILVPGTGVILETFIGIADGAERSEGVTFIIRADGLELERRVVQPGRWERLSVALPARLDGPVTLTLETDLAPGGTTNFGWAVWGEPRLVSTP